MIIPIRCFTCNKILGSLYKKYSELLEINNGKEESIEELEEITIEKSNVKIFEKLNIDRYCCRRHLMSHIDLIQKI